LSGVISEIQIQNFKSIQDLTLRPGRVTVLIGENGSGKSNVLEGIAFAACAAVDKLDYEFLERRGIRVTEDTWMISAFPEAGSKANGKGRIEFRIKGGKDDEILHYRVAAYRRKEDDSFLKWRVAPVSKTEVEEALQSQGTRKETPRLKDMWRRLDEFQNENRMPGKNDGENPSQDMENNLSSLRVNLAIHLATKKRKLAGDLALADFLIYAPEYSVLGGASAEGAIQSLGTKGQGLFRLLRSFENEKFKDRLEDLQDRLHVFGWFDGFILPDELSAIQARLQIHDRWLASNKAIFDQRSANEGFLFVLFYFTLLLSWRTPMFFAIDNIDTALNPRLCSFLMQQVVELAKKYGKQVICTTHNPAILDGLDLKDDEQRLYTIQRDSEGHTVARRVRAPEPQRPGEWPGRLSEAFVRGLIGGLPKHF
jgi:predicted ATPase